MAWSLGAADGDRLDRDRAIDLVARVAAAVGIPVTADIESGFADDDDGVGETISGVLAAGAVGVNLEDSLQTGPAPLRPAEEQAERVAAARRAADTAGDDDTSRRGIRCMITPGRTSRAPGAPSPQPTTLRCDHAPVPRPKPRGARGNHCMITAGLGRAAALSLPWPDGGACGQAGVSERSPPQSVWNAPSRSTRR